MGNLYTQVVRRSDSRISHLWKLKLAWINYRYAKTEKTRKACMKIINNLRKSMMGQPKKSQPNKTIKPLTREEAIRKLQKKFGAFAWKHEREILSLMRVKNI